MDTPPPPVIMPVALQSDSVQDTLSDKGRLSPAPPSSPESSPSTEYACGPIRAWSTVFGAWIMQFSVVGIMSAFGVTQAFYLKGYLGNQSAFTVSWIGSAQTFLDLTLAVPGGWLLDRGYFRHCVIAGSTVFIVCHFMLSLAKPDQYYQIFLTQGIGMGIGIGLIFLPTSAVVSQHFKTRKVFPMGVVTSGGPLGGAVFSIALNYLLNSSLSFGAAIRITAFVVLGLLVLGNLLVFQPPQNGRGAKSDPPAEDIAKTEPAAIATAKSASPSMWSASFWDAQFVCFLVMGFCFGLGMWFPPTYVQLYAEQHGISGELGFYALAILNVATAFGRVLPNWFGDRWGILDVYLPCVLCASALQFAMLGCSTPYGLVLFTVFYGFFYGTTVSFYLPVVECISDKGVDIGKRMGIGLVPAGVAGLIGNPIDGALLGRGYVWWKGVTFAGVTMLAGVAVLTFIKFNEVRKHK